MTDRATPTPLRDLHDNKGANSPPPPKKRGPIYAPPKKKTQAKLSRLQTVELMWRQAECRAREAELKLHLQRIQLVRKQQDEQVEAAKITAQACRAECARFIHDLKKKYCLEGEDFTLDPSTRTISVTPSHRSG